jgi:hypothetical protein
MSLACFANPVASEVVGIGQFDYNMMTVSTNRISETKLKFSKPQPCACHTSMQAHHPPTAEEEAIVVRVRAGRSPRLQNPSQGGASTEP